MNKLLLPILVLAALAQGQTKKRVAVLDFDYATVRSTSAAIFGTDRDIGRGIADMMIEKFVNGGVYSVIERSAINKVLAEQNFSNSDRADPSSAARIGRVLGVDAIIMGSITQFGRDDKSTGIGGGALGGIGRKYGLGGVNRKEAKAVVGVTARLVSTETAEILAVATAQGESNRSGTSLLGAGGSAAGAGVGEVDMASSNFAATLIGEAATKAVQSTVDQMQQKAGSLPQRILAVEGLVADVAGDVLILNVGAKSGITVGTSLAIKRKLREIRDPASGKVIRSIVDNVGQIVITEVDDNSSVGKFTGAGQPKIGDQAVNK
jgi:curli biogenesis system outer membrane secretion channel CsgG